MIILMTMKCIVKVTLAQQVLSHGLPYCCHAALLAQQLPTGTCLKRILPTCFCLCHAMHQLKV